MAVEVYQKVLQLLALHIVLITSVCLNFLISLVIAREKRLRAPGHLFVLSLTASNCLLSLLLIPLTITTGTTEGWSLGEISCQSEAFMSLWTFIASNLTVAIISIDRYCAIVKPMAYNVEITRTKAIGMLLAVWLGSLVISVAPLLGWSAYAFHPHMFVCVLAWDRHPVYTVVVVTFAYILPATIMLVCYTHIYRAAQLQHISQRGRVAPAEESEPFLGSTRRTRLAQKLPWVVVTYSSPRKALRTVLLLMGSFHLLWLTIFIWLLCEFLRVSTAPLAFISFLVTCTASAAYPILYGLMNKKLRLLARNLCCGGRRKSAKLIPIRPSASGTSLSANPSCASFLDYLPRKISSGVDSYDLLQLRQKWADNDLKQNFVTKFIRSHDVRAKRSTGSMSPGLKRGPVRRSGSAPARISLMVPPTYPNFRVDSAANAGHKAQKHLAHQHMNGGHFEHNHTIAKDYESFSTATDSHPIDGTDTTTFSAATTTAVGKVPLCKVPQFTLDMFCDDNHAEGDKELPTTAN